MMMMKKKKKLGSLNRNFNQVNGPPAGCHLSAKTLTIAVDSIANRRLRSQTRHRFHFNLTDVLEATPTVSTEECLPPSPPPL